MCRHISIRHDQALEQGKRPLSPLRTCLSAYSFCAIYLAYVIREPQTFTISSFVSLAASTVNVHFVLTICYRCWSKLNIEQLIL